MARHFESLTKREIEWLKLHRYEPITVICEKLGVTRDTAKRWMHRLKIRKFPGAKYQEKISADVVMWDRPCTRCGDQAPRPKWQYFCDSCREYLDHENGESNLGSIYEDDAANHVCRGS